ncbi:MAG TPA: sulfotransferase [Myxococcales bacterium]|nr:sulfotransferase [Myxococcales bacterium]
MTDALVPAPRLPPGWRFFSRVMDAWVALGGFRFDAEWIIARAMEREGRDDLGPDAGLVREALAVYCESLLRDARPHGLGRFYLHRRMCRLSVHSRLRVAPLIRAGARPLRAPLIVCGLPRSGTTLLHRLLELADDAAGIPLWQLIDPMPPHRGPDRRRLLVERSVSRLGRVVPTSLDAQHYVRPDLADECGHLMRSSFAGSMPWQAPAFGWLEWSLRQDALPAYRAWAAYLSALEPEGKRLVLKDPFHAARLEEIHAVCPDAMVAQTHRDPLEIVPSFHKLCMTMHAVMVPALDVPRTVAAHTDWLSWVVERNAAARSRFPPRQLVDVDYRALVADPVAQVERIHRAFNLPLTGRHVERMRAYLAENGQRRHGPNPYSAEAFGQRPEELAERFAAYRRRFNLERAA